jgi:hypothetical protein
MTTPLLNLLLEDAEQQFSGTLQLRHGMSGSGMRVGLQRASCGGDLQ